MSSLNKRLYKYCKANNITEIYLIQNEPVNWNYGLYGACEGGHKDLVLVMIKNGANDWNRGLGGACKGGHKDLVLFMIEKGANDWERALQSSCYGGYKELVLFMIEKGASDFNLGLQSACYGGQEELALFMIEKGATNWNAGLCCACDGGHVNLALLMVRNGANNWDESLKITAMEKSCINSGRPTTSSHKECALLMLACGAKMTQFPLTNTDIIYLLRNRVKDFGNQASFAAKWEKWVREVELYLDNILIADLTDVILSY